MSELANEKVKKLARKYELNLLVLFGSRVTGKIHRESDYDVAYASGRVLDLSDEGHLIVDLMPVLGVRDERLINLVNIKKAKPLLLYAMTKECQVLYEREPALFANLQAFAFKQYVETKPIFEEQARRNREALLHTVSN